MAPSIPHAAETLSLRQMNRATLARQMLLARERIDVTKAIERLVALQAQWPRPPFLGLWCRLQGFERAQLTKQFAKRAVVRATFLRGTIHVLSAKDYLRMRPAVQPALDAAMSGILRSRLDAMDVDRVIARAREFFDAEPRTFEDLRDEFLRADPKADERAMGYAVRMRLPLVQVPDEDAPWAFPQPACFAPADRWLESPVVTQPAKPDALLLRYLAAYGPATPRDFQAWSGLSPASARDAFGRLSPRLLRFRSETRQDLFDVPDAPRPDGDVPAPVRLVPEYDNLIATRADERFVAKKDRSRVFLSALRIAPTVLVDGFVAATWKLAAGRRAVTITIEPFGSMAAPVRRLVTAEAEAVASFAEPEAASVEVKFS
jgi:hypothetical protein